MYSYSDFIPAIDKESKGFVIEPVPLSIKLDYKFFIVMQIQIKYYYKMLTNKNKSQVTYRRVLC